MTSLRFEDGYARIPNELLDSLATIRLPGQENQIVFAVLRKTYGFNKERDSMSHGQLSAATGIKRVKVVELVKSLVLKKVLGSTNNGTRKPSTIWINNNYSEWEHSPKKGTSPKLGTIASPQKGSSPSPQKGTHKIQPTKYNLQKKTPIVPFPNLPEFLSKETWMEFRQYRNEIKKPMSELAETKIINKLIKWNAKGHDITDILDTAIVNRWQGLYEPANNGERHEKRHGKNPGKPPENKSAAGKYSHLGEVIDG